MGTLFDVADNAGSGGLLCLMWLVIILDVMGKPPTAVGYYA